MKLRGTKRSRILRSVRDVLTTVLAYYVYWLPTAVYAVITLTGQEIPAWWLLFLAGQMLTANSAMSFPIYLLTNPSFRTQFLATIRLGEYFVTHIV